MVIALVAIILRVVSGVVVVKGAMDGGGMRREVDNAEVDIKKLRRF